MNAQAPRRAPRPSEADWRGLATQLDGPVFRPGDPGHRYHSRLFNERYDGRRPAAVASVVSPADVARAIAWTREHDTPVVARSGGHSFAGYSVNDGLVIDLSRLSHVAADGSTGLVTVGGGTRVGALYDAMRPYEMAISAGTHPAVGVAGLTLGGGAEFTSRKLGLTTDALVETSLVTADGKLLTCNARENADLFWACRGGGGGNFGVNVSFTFQAQPVRDVSTCTITWKWSDAVEVLDALQRTIYDAPDEFAARLGLSTAGADRAAARRNATVTTVAQLLGPTHELRALLDPALTVARPLTDEFADRTFWEAKGHMVHATSGGRFALRSRYAKRLVAPRALEEMVRWVERWPGSGNPDGGGIGMFSWGGRINRLRATDTAFMHRDTLFLVSMDTSWTGADSPATVRATLDWLDGLHDALGGHLSDSAYQNFIDPQLSNWESAYYGENYARLVAVKRKYDPDDVFRFDQSIGSGRDLSAPAQVEAA